MQGPWSGKTIFFLVIFFFLILLNPRLEGFSPGETRNLVALGLTEEQIQFLTPEEIEVWSEILTEKYPPPVDTPTPLSHLQGAKPDWMDPHPVAAEEADPRAPGDVGIYPFFGAVRESPLNPEGYSFFENLRQEILAQMLAREIPVQKIGPASEKIADGFFRFNRDIASPNRHKRLAGYHDICAAHELKHLVLLKFNHYSLEREKNYLFKANGPENLRLNIEFAIYHLESNKVIHSGVIRRKSRDAERRPLSDFLTSAVVDIARELVGGLESPLKKRGHGS